MTEFMEFVEYFSGADTSKVEHTTVFLTESTSTCPDLKSDWICDVSGQSTWRILVGNLGVCVVPTSMWATSIAETDRNVFLHTGCVEWIWLVDRSTYTVCIEKKEYCVWIGEMCKFSDVLKNTSIKQNTTCEARKKLKNDKPIQTSNSLFARCVKSVDLLDNVHRDYISKHTFKKNDIVAIRSVAGSGKTTTLIDLMQRHGSKKILYLAFNKSLITEVKDKLTHLKIKNTTPMTFDALMYRLYTSQNGNTQKLSDLKPFTIGSVVPFLSNKNFTLKQYYCDLFTRFCGDVDYKCIDEFCKTTLENKNSFVLVDLWNKCLANEFMCFDSMRKQAFVFEWCKQYIDVHYDMVMIDETQDFDMIMLQILLRDTTVPKIFVGDSKQAIYDFRGCIDAFEHLPNNAIFVEFYSTFRVGNPACQTICKKIPDCWMVSKSPVETIFVNSYSMEEKYTYLFRTWKQLFKVAAKKKSIWIYGFDRKKSEIIALHAKISKFKHIESNGGDSDDLPMFLKTLSASDLKMIIDNIEDNSVDFEDARIRMYTIHSFKGMEDDNIRVHWDISVDKHRTLYYVAITRGMRKILMEENHNIDKEINKKTYQYVNHNIKSLHQPTITVDGGGAWEISSTRQVTTCEKYDRIKEWRKVVSMNANIPAYRVVSDRTIQEIARIMPKTKHELSNITGIGPVTIKKFGNDLLSLCHGEKKTDMFLCVLHGQTIKKVSDSYDVSADAVWKNISENLPNVSINLAELLPAHEYSEIMCTILEVGNNMETVINKLDPQISRYVVESVFKQNTLECSNGGK